MLEKLGSFIAMRHHAQSGGKPAAAHNALEATLANEEEVLQALENRDPTLVKNYSEDEIEQLTKNQVLHTLYVLSLVIDSNEELPLADRYNHIG